MPRGKKAGRATPGQITKDAFIAFLTKSVAPAKQDLDDANMAHAGAWKQAEPLGINTQAAKAIAKLDRMEDTKRADWLRSFDRYRDWMGFNDQPDLWDDDEARSAPPDYNPDAGATDDPPPPDLADREAEPEPAARAAPAEDTPTVEADLGDEGIAERSEDLEAAGYTFAAGRSAATSGIAANDCPHPEGVVSRDIWMRGYAQGIRDVAEMNAEEKGNVAQLSQRRRSTEPQAATA